MPPTIQVPASYDAEADCAALKKAMKGFGTDEATIINILAHRNNAQRQDLASKYKSMYGKVGKFLRQFYRASLTIRL
jgi:hypothetical protein